MLDEEEKKEIREIIKKNDENLLFEYIDNLLLDKINFTLEFCATEQAVKKGSKAKEFWGKEKEELYRKFLTMPEKVKQGRHTKAFKDEVQSNLSDITLNRYYTEFVKRYNLQKIDDDLIKFAKIELIKNMT